MLCVTVRKYRQAYNDVALWPTLRMSANLTYICSSVAAGVARAISHTSSYPNIECMGVDLYVEWCFLNRRKDNKADLDYRAQQAK